MDGTQLVEALAREHTEHLRWLAARHRHVLEPEALEEVLQESYAKAITALGRTPAPSFRDHDAARGWLRRIANHAAIDAVRARNGRRPGSRPQTVELEDADAHAADPQVEAEEALLSAAERDHGVHVIARAIRELPDHYQRILRWRYRNGMEPQAIARLERISPRSYEGQHRRAVAALRTAVAGMDLGTGCDETRRQLRRRLGGPSARHARAHVETCMPCLAFERRLRGALAIVPVSPTAVAMELMIRPSHSGSGSESAPAAKAGAAGQSATAAKGGAMWAKAVAGAAASAVATAGATAALATGGAMPAPTSTPSALGDARAGKDRHTLPRHSAKLFLNSRVGSPRGVR